MQKVSILGHKLFEPGRTLITRNANEVLNPEDVTHALSRHISGDWGGVCPEDRRSNNFAVKNGMRILSTYKDRNDVKFWIITEADRSYTTVMLVLIQLKGSEQAGNRRLLGESQRSIATILIEISTTSDY